MSAGPIDRHKWDGTDIKVCVILDDASRMVLAGGEFSEINTENSKLVIDQLADKVWCPCPMRESYWITEASLEPIGSMMTVA
jgi:putative transposase